MGRLLGLVGLIWRVVKGCFERTTCAWMWEIAIESRGALVPRHALLIRRRQAVGETIHLAIQLATSSSTNHSEPHSTG
jgi:hypothetical protein